MEKIKDRSEVEEQYKWDLTKIYKTEEEFRKDISKALKLIEKVPKHENTMLDSAKDLYDTTTIIMDTSRLIQKIYTYASLKYNENIADTSSIALREDALNLDHKLSEKAAFYGPKIDIQIKTALNHDVTIPTCQLDFALPERFDLTYVDKDGSKKRPVMLHRVIYGSIERFIGILIEHYGGAFPLWLSPVQVNIIPVNNEYHLEYAKTLENILKENGIRVKMDAREEKLSYRMRESQTKKIPYTLIIGDKEKDDNKVSYRKFGSNETTTVDTKEFINILKDLIKDLK